MGDGSNDADWRSAVPFRGFVDIAPHLGDKIPQNSNFGAWVDVFKPNAHSINTVDQVQFLMFIFVHLSMYIACSGYGFVDYDSMDAAETAIRALQAAGVQAQLAKVPTSFSPLTSRVAR